MVSSSPATPQITAGNHGSRPNRLTAVSRLTTKQLAFAKLWANGLNSAAECYRQAYSVSSKDWWCRQSAYNLIQKPHIQAVVTRLKAEYDSVRPALTRATKREILRDMTISESLDPADRQRAIDLDNKMQGEYSERLHLTGDVTLTMFRMSAGAIPWQLAENLPKEDPSIINVEAKAVSANDRPKAIPEGGREFTIESSQNEQEGYDSRHSKAISSSSNEKAYAGIDPSEKLSGKGLNVEVPSMAKDPTPQPTQPKGRKYNYRPKLTPEQVKVLGKTYANRRRKTKD